MSIFVIPFGVAYGIAAVERGMTPVQAVGASALTFSGAAQFAVLDQWDAEISLVAVVLVTFAVSARLIVMGAALAPWVNQLDLRRRILSALFLTDPNFAHTHNALRARETDLGVLVGSGAIGWVAWVIGTGLGASGGLQLVDPRAFGIDVVMPAFFAAMVVPRAMEETRHGYIVVAALCAVMSQPVLPTGWNIIFAAVAGGVVGGLSRDE
ncbi:MAG: AzlC family ABC transporter permease [Pseudomonadota bacterium]